MKGNIRNLPEEHVKQGAARRAHVITGHCDARYTEAPVERGRVIMGRGKGQDGVSWVRQGEDSHPLISFVAFLSTSEVCMWVDIFSKLCHYQGRSLGNANQTSPNSDIIFCPIQHSSGLGLKCQLLLPTRPPCRAVPRPAPVLRSRWHKYCTTLLHHHDKLELLVVYDY